MSLQEEKMTTPALSWVAILEQTKAAHESTCKELESFLICIRQEFQPWYNQISDYAAEMAIEKIDSTLPTTEHKDLVLQTRAALRFGLYCLSTSDGNVPKAAAIPIIQGLTVTEYHWHRPLLSLLSCRRNDSKCRTLASRLLCNLVTCNTQTALKLSMDVELAPSQRYVDSTIRENIVTMTTDTSIVDEARISASSTIDAVANTIGPNWVDMILWAAKSGNREALAAITAALHNCIVSMVDYDNEKRLALPCDYAESVASNGMLISTFLRNFVAAHELQKSVANENKASRGNGVTENADHWDSATDWIQLLLAKLTNLGLLPKMYHSISGGNDTNQSSTRTLVQLLPEQTVLLHCMAREADSYVMAFGSNSQTMNPFGEESGIESAISCYSFLCDLFIDFSTSVHPPLLSTATASKEDDADVFETTLVRSGLVTVADILASTLGMDNSLINTLRLHISDQTVVLQETAMSLGRIIDDLAEKSEGKRARDIHLEQDAQKLFVSFVRLIGNLCFRCPPNQNLLRTTLVPPTIKSAARTTTTPSTPQQQQPNQSQEDDVDSHPSSGGGGSDKPRNGLHVLLSCTSYATSCFTLREWAVIAIRNALEDNEGNQDVVAELVAQDSVQTADLETAGIRVQLDSKGNVSLKKLDTTITPSTVPVIQEDVEEDVGDTLSEESGRDQ
jgi:hypothetical protein